MKVKKLSSSLLILLFCLFLTLPAIRFLFRPGFFPSFDGHLHLYRAMQLKKSLLDGHFPVRWGGGFFYGFGFPLFNFYSTLFYYLTALFTLPGLSFLAATKALLIITFILSALFMFLLAKEFWGLWGATISAIAYIYAPYQFVELYVRGGFPELLTFPLLPLIFWSFYELFKTKKPIFLFLSACSFALLPLAHNFIAIATFPFLLGFLLYLYSQKKGAIIFLPLIFGLLLSSFFWLPAALEKNYLLPDVFTLNYDFRDSFLYPQQLLYSPWGYGGNVRGPGDGMSLMIGFPHIFLVFLSLFLKGRLKKSQAKILTFIFLGFLAATLMTLEISILIWELLPFFSIAQFPWRFLVLVVFFASWLSGVTIFIFRQAYHQKNLALALLSLIILLNSPLAHPKSWNLKDRDAFYEQSIWGVPRARAIGADFTPRWVLKRPQGPPESKIIPSIPLEEASFKTHYYQFKASFSEETQFTVNTFYFPGWRAYIDNQTTKIEIPDAGTMQINVPQGTHQIKFIFGETPLRKTADLISLFSLIVLLMITAKSHILTEIEKMATILINKIQKSRLWKQATT